MQDGVTSCYVMSCQVMSCIVVDKSRVPMGSFSRVACRVMSRRVMLCYVMSCHVSSLIRVVSRWVRLLASRVGRMSCRVMVCKMGLCYVVLCFVVEKSRWKEYFVGFVFLRRVWGLRFVVLYWDVYIVYIVIAYIIL